MVSDSDIAVLNKTLSGLSPEAQERLLRSIGAVSTFLRHCVQHGYSGAVLVMIEGGGIERVCGRFGDPEAGNPYDEDEGQKHYVDLADFRGNP